PFAIRSRNLGNRYPSRLGIRNNELRVVDRNRTRRHPNLGDPTASPPEMAHFNQSFGGSHDHFCRYLRRAVSALASWPAVVFLFFASLSQHDGSLAPISECACLGCVCRWHLFHS